MSEITLYLHIGSGKTGTSAVQRFLTQSFSELLELGVLYPNFYDEDICTPMQPVHNYGQGRYFENIDSSYDLEMFNRCIQYCKENSLHSIVISHEAFLVNWPDRIGQLAGKLDAKIKIICYVRRQDHYLEAIWKQWGHKFISADELLDSIDRKEWGVWRHMDWHALILIWAKNFGKENIIIRPYEKEQLPDGILPDFLNVIGIVWPEKPSINSGLSVNVGFSRDVLEFLYLNRGLYDDFKDRSIYNMLNHVLDDNFKKKPFDAYGILSPKDRIALLEKYELSNQMLAREYLNREDGRLFYEPWPSLNDDWEPYEGLSVERLTPILTKIVYYLYEQQNASDRRYKALNENYQALKQQQEAFNRILQKSDTTSSFKKLKLFVHRIRVRLVPPKSRQDQVLLRAFHLFILVLSSFNPNLDENSTLIRNSGLFDESWYLANYPDVARSKTNPFRHYLRYGGFEGRDPGPKFSSNWYLNTYKDVKETTINPLLHYLKYGKNNGRKPKPDPIVVHQMGKVGSKTVRLSLQKTYENLGIKIPVYHTHALNNFDAMRKGALLNQAERNPVGTLTSLKYGEIVRKQIDENPAQHWNIISLVRDPIARNIATFFHNLAEFIPDWRERYADGKLNAEEIYALFISKNSMFAALDNWFDPQMKSVPAIGIDVYETPFPCEIGYKIYPCVSQASLLLIRQESLNECAARAMLEFLGLQDFTLHNTNIADEKDYADLYRAFKEIPLPAEYVARVYKTQFARHFYSDEELEQFTQRWTKSAKTENRILPGSKPVAEKGQTTQDTGKGTTSQNQLTQEPAKIGNSKVKIALGFRRIRSFIFGSNRVDPNQKEVAQEDLELLRSSSLFDESWYLANYPDVARAKIDPALHYLRTGGSEGRDPGPNFSSNWYLDTYEDVRKAGVNPLVHYLKYGGREGIKPKQDAGVSESLDRFPFLRKINRSIQHWRLLSLIRISGLFDKTWYLSKNPDVAKAGVDPLFHYLRRGGFEGRDPGPHFSSNWYLYTYPDAKETGLNPLVHYLKYGEHAGHKPKPDPIVVHQMGKVGSKTVRLSLQKAYENLGIKIPVYHTHALNNFDAMRKGALLNQGERNPVGTLTSLKYGEIVRKQIDENPAQHWNIISLVRDPVARNIATFFNNLAEFIPNWRERYADGKLNAEEIYALFVSKNSMFAALDDWFDPQMKSVPAIGIDVYETPFPREIGYKIYPCASQASLLLIRQESLNECAARAMLEFLGLQDFTLHNTNIADEKDYANLYRAFKEIPLPAEYVERVYKTQFARHFYSDQELERFTQRWTKNSKTEDHILSGSKRVVVKEQTTQDTGKDILSSQPQAQLAGKEQKPAKTGNSKLSKIALAFRRIVYSFLDQNELT